MKNKIIIVCMLLLSCLPSLHAGRHSSNFAAGAIGAAAGMFLGAAIASNSNNHCRHTHSHTEYVHVPYNNYYTERVEVSRPVVETRRVYTQPTRRVVTHYNRPYQTEVYYNRAYAPAYNEYCYVNY